MAVYDVQNDDHQQQVLYYQSIGYLWRIVAICDDHAEAERMIAASEAEIGIIGLLGDRGQGRPVLAALDTKLPVP